MVIDYSSLNNNNINSLEDVISLRYFDFNLKYGIYF